jgi:hypothetical protein
MHPTLARSDPISWPVTPAIYISDLAPNHPSAELCSTTYHIHPVRHNMPSSLTTLSELQPGVHLITLSSPPDNRLTPQFLKSLSDNLDDIESKWRAKGGGMSPPDPSKKNVKVEGGAVIITGIGKFFSNGLDYENANKNKRFFEGMSKILG